jgi:adenylate cyclase
VKTIGDAYLAVAGGAQPAPRGAAVNFARNLIHAVGEIASRENLPVSVRVGIHTGPVVGGVIGSTRMTYDYWGDTMNIASRVQGAAQPGGICVTEPTFFEMREFQLFGPARLIVLKGVGEMKVYDAILS